LEWVIADRITHCLLDRHPYIAEIDQAAGSAV